MKPLLGVTPEEQPKVASTRGLLALIESVFRAGVQHAVAFRRGVKQGRVDDLPAAVAEG